MLCRKHTGVFESVLSVETFHRIDRNEAFELKIQTTMYPTIVTPTSFSEFQIHSTIDTSTIKGTITSNLSSSSNSLHDRSYEFLSSLVSYRMFNVVFPSVSFREIFSPDDEHQPWKNESIGLTFRAANLSRNRFTADAVLEWNYTFHGRAEKNGRITLYHFRSAITLYFIMSFATDVTASCSL